MNESRIMFDAERRAHWQIVVPDGETINGDLLAEYVKGLRKGDVLEVFRTKADANSVAKLYDEKDRTTISEIWDRFQMSPYDAHYNGYITYKEMCDAYAHEREEIERGERSVVDAVFWLKNGSTVELSVDEIFDSHDAGKAARKLMRKFNADKCIIGDWGFSMHGGRLYLD